MRGDRVRDSSGDGTLDGLDAIYGVPIADLPVHRCPPEAADLLAWAHWRVHGALAAVHAGGGRLVVPADVHLDRRRWQEPPAGAVEQLRGAQNIVVLAGPGVVHAGAVPGLHALATAGGLGVVNTWG